MRSFCWIAGFALAGLGGCSSGSTELPVPPLHSVEGAVTLDGQPLAGAQVMLLPRGATKGQGAFASTEDDGSFVLKYNSGDEGCPEGDYVVLISKLQMRDGKPIPEGETAADVDAVDIVPPIYKDPEAPLNGIRISGPKSDLLFELRSR
jgi:hypothetical protein